MGAVAKAVLTLHWSIIFPQVWDCDFVLCSCLLNKLQLLQKEEDMKLFCNLTSYVDIFIWKQPVIYTGENKTSTRDLWDGVVND